jgi:CPA1 family monovalent cation:H+ antiporter
VSTIAIVVLLFAVAVAFDLLARRLGIARPVLLIIGGGLLAFIPGLPRLTVAPDTIFLLFVPPLLYQASLHASFRDFRTEWRSIALLATVPVLLTTIAVAAVARALSPEYTWAAAFTLGAIVAPPDAVAAIASTRRLRLPQRIVALLSGESLVNDATALVTYRIAVAAVVTGRFSARAAVPAFVLAALGGVAIGLGAGWLVGVLRRRLPEAPEIENTVSLLTPYIAYLPAAALGASGILAVVACGLYLARVGPSIVSPATRIMSVGLWSVVTFLLESLTFMLIGIELPQLAPALHAVSARHLAAMAILVVLTTIVVRLVWIFPGAALSYIGRQWPGWRGVLFVGWAGLRGGDSVVIALALPVAVASGAPFPARERTILQTFAVIFGTLVIQGLTLAPVARLLGLHADDGQRHEETVARRAMLEAGLARLDELARKGAPGPLVEYLRVRQTQKLRSLGQPAGAPQRMPVAAYLGARLAMLAAERRALLALRDTSTIGDGVMRRLQEDLDLESVLLTHGSLDSRMDDTDDDDDDGAPESGGSPPPAAPDTPDRPEPALAAPVPSTHDPLPTER